jgi:hypothetical protein
VREYLSLYAGYYDAPLAVDKAIELVGNRYDVRR